MNRVYLWLIFLMYVGGGYAMVATHENIHVQIFRSYGIESEVFWDWDRAYTRPEDACPTEKCEELHNWNELIGYYLLTLYTTIGGLWIVKEMSRESEKDDLY
jgi:hypothetical protein